MTGFEDLLYQAQKLSAEVNNDPEMPRLQRNLPHLLESSSQLLNRLSATNTSRDLTEVRASVLLGSKGYDLLKVSRNLDTVISRGLKLSASTQVNAPFIRETDIQGFLKNERENAILQLIDDVKNRSRDEVDKQLWHSIEREWDQDKVAILNAMVEQDQDQYELDNVSQSGYDHGMTPMMTHHGMSSGLQYQHSLPLTNLTGTYAGFGARTPAQTLATPHLPKSGTQFTRFSQSSPLNPLSPSSPTTMSYISNQGPMSPMQSFGGAANTSTSLLMGRTLPHATTQSPYIERSIHNSIDPRPAKSNMDFVEILYAKCVMAYVDKVASSGFRLDVIESFINNIRSEFVENNILDMWAAVSNIIATSGDGCNNLRRNNINYQMNADDQSFITSNDSGQYENQLAHFKTLLLTGQLEQAVEFLFRSQRFRCHAVHVAIALNEANLLRKPDVHQNQPLLSKVPVDTSNVQDMTPNDANGSFVTRLNYVDLISRYTKKFAHSNPVEAMYYYYLLRDCSSTATATPSATNNQSASTNSSLNHDNLFVSYVSELVRETKDFDNLLGYMSDFGRVSGVIDRFHQNVDEIATRVAEDCENSGDYEDAVKLYDLASRHAKVMSILSKLLSEVVTERKVAGSSRDRLEIIAMKIADRYCEPGTNAPRDTSGTFYLLLDLMTFFNYYHNGQDAEALDTIQKLNLLPFATGEVELKAREFSKYPGEVRRNVAEILLATMNILHAMYKQAKATAATSARMSASDSQNREQQCRDVQQKARALITFSGMIQYRMPPDTISRLIELEVLIN